jgi:hypothetical protein
MGLFRRSRPAAGPTGPDLTSGGHAASAVTPTAEPPAVQRDAAGGEDATPAWRSAPPLRPTVTPPTSTFKIGAAVKEDLVALDSPRLSHGMGHLVGGDGPTGVVGGLATVAVQRRSGSPDAAPGSGVVPASADVPGTAAPDLPVVARLAHPGGNGDGDHGAGGPAPGPAEDWRRGLLTPRILPAGDDAPPGDAGRFVEAPTVDTAMRHRRW